MHCYKILNYSIFQEPELGKSVGGQGIFYFIHKIMHVSCVMRELP